MRFSFLLILLCPFALAGQNADWKSKIDPKLWDYSARPDTAVEFLVIMLDQADVSAAKDIQKKEDKGQYVLETLSRQAERTQRNLRDMLHNTAAPFQSFWVVNALWVKGDRNLLEEIAQFPEVGRIELNPVWHMSQPEQSSVETPVVGDRSNPLSWGLTRINADDLWNMGYTGSGIVVGGQDTGYEWSHPAIKSHYRGWNGSSVDHNYNWHDAIHAIINGGANSCGLNLNHPCDDHNHGTHTVGTMVGETADADSTFGVAPGAQWMGCRNMEEGDGTPATYIECFQWFIAPTNLSGGSPDASKAPHVINNSWGCPTSEGCNATNYGTMETVVNNVRSAGIVVVVSAGNDGSACSTVNSPAAIFNSSYTVGSTNASDFISNFSSRGPVNVYTAIKKPDISAPGEGILSCVGHDNQSGTYSYEAWNGTSMAGPHVVGVVALLLEVRPNLIGQVDAIENVINQSAVPLFSTSQSCGGDNATTRPNNVYGWGRIDALAAKNLALPVELAKFSAKAVAHGALLEWLTGVEIECAHFSVQRSADGISWQSIGIVPCRGSGIPYQFTDPSPIKGVNYYRLEQFDISGKSYFSPIRTVSMAPTGYTLRSGMGDDKFYYEVVGEHVEEYTWIIEICAMDGRIIQRQAVGYKGWVEMPELPAGIGLVILRNSDGQALATEKLVYMR